MNYKKLLLLIACAALGILVGLCVGLSYVYYQLIHDTYSELTPVTTYADQTPPDLPDLPVTGDSPADSLQMVTGRNYYQSTVNSWRLQQ